MSEWKREIEMVDLRGKDAEKLLKLFDIAIEIPAKIVLSSKAQTQYNTLLTGFADTEWGAGLRGEKREGYYFIEELVVTEQEVGTASVEMTDDGNVALAKEKGIIGWTHSHNTMSVFHSGTDQHNNLNYEVSITVNNKKEADARVKIKINNKVAFIEGEVVNEQDFLIYPEFLEAAKALIKTKTHTYKGYAAGYYNGNGGTYGSSAYDEWRDGEWHRYSDEIPHGRIEDDECCVCGNKVSKKRKQYCIECKSLCHITCMDDDEKCYKCGGFD